MCNNHRHFNLPPLPIVIINCKIGKNSNCISGRENGTEQAGRKLGFGLAALVQPQYYQFVCI